jgi:hypothetical protein
MKFQEYLIIEEEQGLDYYLPKIQKECKQFLKDIKGAAGTLFRINKGLSLRAPVIKKVTRKDRQPLDSNPKLHKLLDEWFNKKFGWKARSNVLFCWPLQFSSPLILQQWMVFPAGNYKYVWSTSVHDLWGELGDFNYDEVDNMYAFFIHQLSKTYTDKKLKMSTKFQNEIMVNCEYSYLVKPELLEQVNEMLGLNWQGATF